MNDEYGYRYNPGHIRNADFDQGTEAWTVSPAEPDTMTVEQFAGLGWMQGRYPRGSEGDNFLVTKRSAEKPNVFSQTIMNLRRGRLYSVKMFTADYDDLLAGKSAEKKLTVSVEIDGADLVQDKSVQHVFKHYPGHFTPPFTRKNRFVMNFHRYVFRAKAKTAVLRISDWADEQKPGGLVGQRIAYNFIEIQAYLDSAE